MENPPAGTSPMAMVGPFAEPAGVVPPFTSGPVIAGAAASSSITWNAISAPAPCEVMMMLSIAMRSLSVPLLVMQSTTSPEKSRFVAVNV